MAEALDIEVDVAAAFVPLYHPARYKVYWGGRGSGKSWHFARALLQMGVQRTLRILCTRELQKSINDSVHQLLVDQIHNMGLAWAYEILKTEIRSRINGTMFLFGGIKHSITEMKSTEGVDICWVEEAEAVTAESWRVLIPTIRKERSEIWVSFNPRRKADATYQRFIVRDLGDRGHVQKVSWRDNPWFPDVLRQEMEADKAADYNMYRHVWEGEFLTVAEHAMYKNELKLMYEEGRITPIPIDQGAAVNTFWDIGKNDATAIWFHQHVGMQDRFIDYEEMRQSDVADIAAIVLNKGYVLGTHYLPHDAKHDRLGMVQTVYHQLIGLGIRPIKIVPRVRHINEGIMQMRRAFPRAWIDPDRCERGLEALSHYELKFDPDNDVYMPNPPLKWATNGADAIRQWAQGYKGPNQWTAMNPHKVPSRDGVNRWTEQLESRAWAE